MSPEEDAVGTPRRFTSCERARQIVGRQNLAEIMGYVLPQLTMEQGKYLYKFVFSSLSSPRSRFAENKGTRRWNSIDALTQMKTIYYDKSCLPRSLSEDVYFLFSMQIDANGE